jgi:hypothetical protein
MLMEVDSSQLSLLGKQKGQENLLWDWKCRIVSTDCSCTRFCFDEGYSGTINVAGDDLRRMVATWLTSARPRLQPTLGVRPFVLVTILRVLEVLSTGIKADGDATKLQTH